MMALALSVVQSPQQSDCRGAVYRCGGGGNAEDHQRAHPNGQGCGVRVMKSNTFEKVFSDFIVDSAVYLEGAVVTLVWSYVGELIFKSLCAWSKWRIVSCAMMGL